MSDTQRNIADLEAKRYQIRNQAAGRWLTSEEREQIRILTKALSEAWELRRLERARLGERDHELVVVRELKERTV